MTELRPLFESSPNPTTRALLRAGLGERPPARAVARTAAAVGVGVTLSASTAGASALGSTVVSAAGGWSAIGALSIVKWLAVGALSGTVVAGGTTLVRRELESAPAADVRRAPAGPSARATGMPLAADEQTRDPRSAREASLPPGVASGTVWPGAALDATQRSPQKQISAEASTSASSDEDTAARERRSPLSVEVSAIDRARASLAAGAAERTLKELTEYERIRATGTLDREAWILRIDALLALGKRREAEALARSYLERFPKDAHTTRLRELAGVE